MGSQEVEGDEVVGSRRAALLMGAGLVSLLFYLAVTLRLPLWRYGGTPQRWSQLLCTYDAGLVGPWGSLAGCLLGLAILVAAYLWGWRLLLGGGARRAEQVRSARRITWAFTFLFAATLFWLTPITSDLFNYLGQAEQFMSRGTNPLLAAAVDPSELGSSRGHRGTSYLTAYASSPSMYGPAWVLLSSPAALGPRVGATGLFYLKGLALVAFLAGAWLVERTVRATAASSTPLDGSLKAVEALYLFAWNPLVLLTAVGDGHNDIVMMALVLMACWLLVRESWSLAFAALVVSVCIKYVGVVLVPLFGLYALRHARPGRGRMWPWALRGGVGLVVLSALVLGPFGGPKWIVEWGLGLPGRFLKPSNWSGNGAGVWGILSDHSAVIMGAGLILFAMVYGMLVWRLARKEPTFGELMRAGFLSLILAFLLGAARSQPWHLIWATALAGLSPSPWAWPAIMGLSTVMLVCQLWVEWGAPGLAMSMSMPARL
jgi:hypothetical protein